MNARFSAAIRPANPAADRDADALLDFLLDPERRPRDELVRLLVEEEDGARVDVEALARAHEQRLEKCVEIEVGEGGVGYRLQPPDVLVWIPPAPSGTAYPVSALFQASRRANTAVAKSNPAATSARTTTRESMGEVTR